MLTREDQIENILSKLESNAIAVLLIDGTCHIFANRAKYIYCQSKKNIKKFLLSNIDKINEIWLVSMIDIMDPSMLVIIDDEFNKKLSPKMWSPIIEGIMNNTVLTLEHRYSYKTCPFPTMDLLYKK